MTDRVSTLVTYVGADVQAVTGTCLVNAVCIMHKENSVGTIEFYDMVGTPGESDVPKCKIDVVTKGVTPVQIPDPGALFLKGVYVKVPGDSTLNLFYKNV